MGALGSKHLLGTAYYRQPRPDDAVSLDAAALIDVLSAAPARPAPRVTVLAEPPSGGRSATWRVELDNASAEASDLATLDSNYLEVQLESGRFESVAAGDFWRYEMLAPGPDGALRRTLDDATVLRLYAPVLRPGAKLVSGPLRLAVTPTGAVARLSARFLAPYGQEITFGPEPWPPAAVSATAKAADAGRN